jgi:UDP-N-acetylmuramoylalanine--D-glutamate ligase
MEDAGQATIGVTGTKGKSTTTTLIGLLLDAAGLTTQVGGNIGVPLTELKQDADVTVAELSSYQCASLKISPRIAVITNLYEDHLTWHGSKHAYWQDKARIAGMGCETLVCDENTLMALNSINAKLPERIIMPDDLLRSRIKISELPKTLKLQQNLDNLHLAVLAADSWLSRQLTEQEIINATTAFHALPHRLEYVTSLDGVTWIDDTLSTIPESIIAASKAFAGEITLLVGGEERGVNYSGLTKHLRERQPLAHLITIPSNGKRIASEYETLHADQVHHASDLEEAVLIAASIAKQGSTIVLSPGAPSYDHFKNFEQKSATFVKAINGLGKTG